MLPIRSQFGGIAASALRFLGFKAKLKDRGALITRLGLHLYDVYNRKIRALPDHSYWGKTRLRAEYASLSDGISAAGLYHEARITHAERLGLELVQDGLAASASSAFRSYTTASHAPGAAAITLKDRISGETSEIRCNLIVNAAGAWIDAVNAGLGLKTQHIGGSKGSHLIVDHPELLAALKGRMIYFGMPDGRVNLVYPFFGHVLIGSTDIPVADADGVQCSPEETAYLLASIAEIFPAIRIVPEQILLAYCGVRPLPRSTGEIGGVTRDHMVTRDVLPDTGMPVLSLIGGKWTTFRAFAAQAADEILQLLGRVRSVSTEALAIGGGAGYPVDEPGVEALLGRIAEAHGLSRSKAQRLFERYGTKASAFAAARSKRDDRPLASLPSYSSAEIAQICATEHVRRLSDILLRRTSIAMEGLITRTVILEIAALAAESLGWSPARQAEEIQLMQSECHRRSIALAAETKAAA